MTSLFPSAIALGTVAAGALWLAFARPPAATSLGERSLAARALILAATIQCVHFGEEAISGFPEALGTLFGLPPMPWTFFVAFNVGWLGLWAASVPGLRSARTPAFFAAWFLAIAGVMNGVVHPLLAIRRGGYFPGLVSSPAAAVASGWLGVRLWAATRAGKTDQPA